MVNPLPKTILDAGRAAPPAPTPQPEPAPEPAPYSFEHRFDKFGLLVETVMSGQEGAYVFAHERNADGDLMETVLREAPR